MTEIRNAEPSDAESILKIYDYYVKNTAITFEYDTPTLSEFQKRMEKITEIYPYLVIVQDGEIKGYAYASKFVDRAAYDWSCKLSIYIDRNSRKCGLGKMLYEALQKKLKAMGIINIYASIAYPSQEDKYLTKNSANFHEHLGFKTVGRFHKCGYKFGRWYDIIWTEKIIGEHKNSQPPINSYKKIQKA